MFVTYAVKAFIDEIVIVSLPHRISSKREFDKIGSFPLSSGKSSNYTRKRIQQTGKGINYAKYSLFDWPSLADSRTQGAVF